MTELMFTCQGCALGYHWECIKPSPSGQCCCSVRPSAEAEEREARQGGVDENGDTIYTNNLSSGRKIAARLHPILPGMTCEWAGLRYAGGGPNPVVGCRDTRLAKVKKNADLPDPSWRRGELHHGPQKNTLDNSPGNLHRICAPCHSHWHALNDKAYSGNRPSAMEVYEPMVPYYMHNADKEATDEELTRSEEWWATRTEQRHDYPFDPAGAGRLVVPRVLKSNATPASADTAWDEDQRPLD